MRLVYWAPPCCAVDVWVRSKTPLKRTIHDQTYSRKIKVLRNNPCCFALLWNILACNSFSSNINVWASSASHLQESKQRYFEVKSLRTLAKGKKKRWQYRNRGHYNRYIRYMVLILCCHLKTLKPSLNRALLYITTMYQWVCLDVVSLFWEIMDFFVLVSITGHSV